MGASADGGRGLSGPRAPRTVPRAGGGKRNGRRSGPWGVLWMLGAICSFATLALAGRALAGELDAFQIMLYRSVISLLVVVGLLAHGGSGETGFGQLRTSVPTLHLGRNLVHYVGQYSWFYALPLLPLAQITALEFSAPVWTILLAAAVLGERLTARRGLAVLLGFGGILVILRPGAVPVEPAALVVLGAAFCYAVVFVVTKRMTATETPLAILFYMFLIQSVVGLGPALPGFVAPPVEDWPWVFAVGVSGLAAHYCLTRAFMAAEAGVVAPVDFLRLPLLGAVGWLLYGEGVDGWLIAGAGLIVAGVWINVRASA